jgi:hypothetical protein
MKSFLKQTAEGFITQVYAWHQQNLFDENDVCFEEEGDGHPQLEIKDEEGFYKWKWNGSEIVSATQEEQKTLQEFIDRQKSIIQSEITKRLSECDHTQLADFSYPDDLPTWNQYRSDLKTVINQEDLFIVIWPEKPSFN